MSGKHLFKHKKSASEWMQTFYVKNCLLLIQPLPLQQQPPLREPLPLSPQLQEPQQEQLPLPSEQTYESDGLTSSWYPLPFLDQSQRAR